MKKYRYLAICSVVFVICSVILPDAVFAAAPKIVCDTVQRRNIDECISISGKINAIETIELSLEYTAYVKKIFIKDGEYAKKGERLLELDFDKARRLLLEQGEYEKAESVSQYLTAPADGYVIKQNAVCNTPVEQYSSLVSFQRSDSLVITAAAGEQDASRIFADMSVLIRGSGFEGRVYRGAVRTVAAAATQNGTLSGFEVIVTIDKPDKYLKSGYTAKLEIITSSTDNALCVPSETIYSDSLNEYVYVVENNRATRRYVETGVCDGEYTQIISGLEQNERVSYNAEDFTSDTVNVVVRSSADVH